MGKSETKLNEAVLGLWAALSRRDWEGLKTFLADDCIYLDVAVGAALAAKGPENIVKRLKIGLEPLATYENFPGLMVDDGVEVVMYEHHEEWMWATGQKAVLRFVSVHRVVNGKVTLWKDYWDMGALTSVAPPNWIEECSKADMSWIFDATGLV